MTRATKLSQWRRLRNRAANAPHGQKRIRERELRQFVLAMLREECAG